MNRFDNIDCMIGMKEYPDKYFDLAIVDPPYGINMDASSINQRKSNSKKYKYEGSNYTKGWIDNKPMDKDYFVELFRVSKNQIIWGANHFISLIPFNSSCWLVWYKNGQNPNQYTADCELAWTNFKTAVRYFNFDWSGFGHINAKEDRIHPTQKPIALYKWLLTKYAKPNDKILDTHVGSASSLIACEDLGFEYVGFELDTDYYNAAQKRLENFRKQLKLAL